MAKATHSKVAAFLNAAIEASSKTQLDIANEAGFPRANIISMLKQGITKLPISRIPATAKALEIDEIQLFRLAMEEYMPEMLEVTDHVYGRDKLNAGETDLLKRLRMHTGGKSFRLNAESDAIIDELGVVLKK